MGGARESFGGSGVIVLADDRRLAAQGTGHRRLPRLEGIDHIHLKEGQPQHSVREETGQRRQGERKQEGRKREGRKDLWRGYRGFEKTRDSLTVSYYTAESHSHQDIWFRGTEEHESRTRRSGQGRDQE